VVQSPERQLAVFIARYDPDVARTARACLGRVRKLVPGAIELVYDNYNALAIGFGPTERASDVIVSIALFPRWVSLFFFRGTVLLDPDHLLKGSGNRARHIVLTDPKVLDSRAVKTLVQHACRVIPRPCPKAVGVARSSSPFPPGSARVVLQSSWLEFLRVSVAT